MWSFEVYTVIKKNAVDLNRTDAMKYGYAYFAIFKIGVCLTVSATQAAGRRAAPLNWKPVGQHTS